MKERKTKEIRKQKYPQSMNKYKRRPEQRREHYVPFVHKRKQYQQIKQIDRSQTCPFLVRVFYAVNDENHYKGKSVEELPIQRQIKLHLWLNSTLKEISELIRAMMPNVRSKQKFTFWRLTYSKDKKQYEKEQMGWVYNTRRYDNKLEEKSLMRTSFKIGDMIDVSITYK